MIIQRNQMPLEIPTGHSGRAWPDGAVLVRNFDRTTLKPSGNIAIVLKFYWI